MTGGLSGNKEAKLVITRFRAEVETCHSLHYTQSYKRDLKMFEVHRHQSAMFGDVQRQQHR